MGESLIEQMRGEVGGPSREEVQRAFDNIGAQIDEIADATEQGGTVAQALFSPRDVARPKGAHMSKPFEREARYVVLKGTDIAQFLTEQEQHRLKNLMATVAQWRVKSGKAPLDVFVLESDWPEFDIAVDMVRRRMEGLPTREAEYAGRLADWQKNYGLLKQERDALVKEAEDTLQFYAEKGRVVISRDGNAVQRLGGSAEIAISKAEGKVKSMVEAIGLHLTYHEHGCAYLDEFAPENTEYQGPNAERVITMGARQPGMQTMRDLAMLVKQLCRGYLIGTRKLDDDRLLATRAMDYLKRKGLDGSPLREGEGSKPWVTEWNAKVPRYNMVAKSDGAYPRETADGEYVLWTDHFAKLQELLKEHGDAALQEIDRLLNENAELKADRDKWQGKAHALNQEMITLTANISRLRRALAPYAQESEWSHATSADQWRLLFNSTDRDGHGYERAQAALLLTEPKEATTAVSPMSTAPRDGTEILAYHIDGKNYHPVFSHGDHWAMRWNDEYYCGDGCYSGWIPYPKGGGANGEQA